jgi:hypothetical protein
LAERVRTILGTAGQRLDGIWFHEIGPVPLKNVAEPVPLHQAFPIDR